MPSDTSVQTRAETMVHAERAGGRPAGAGLILGMAIGALMWGGLLALFLI